MKTRNASRTLALWAAAVGTMLLAGTPAAAVLSYTGGTYVQNFDSLANTGTNIAWTDDATLPGWFANRTTYNAGAGTSTTGALYSFGAAGSGERALGSIASNTTGTILYGVQLINDTGVTLDNFTLSFVGEQWRSAGSATATPSVAQKLDFAYALGATSLTLGAYVDYNDLDFISPVFGTTAASALDGNSAANRTPLSDTIGGIAWLPGQSLWLRWTDVNDANNDHALAIDDLSFTSHLPSRPIPEPASAGLIVVALTAAVGAATRRRANVTVR